MFGKHKKSAAGPRTLADMPDAPEGMYADPVHKFAEIYGSALVGHARMFVATLVMGAIATAAVVGVVVMAGKHTAVPILVEINDKQGIVNKPVRVESIRPNTAVIKAELAKFVVNIFTIDKTFTPSLLKAANVLTTGAATSQFAEFRSTQDILQRISKEPENTRSAKVTSVDVSQAGIAFVFLETEEVRGSLIGMNKAKWRVTIKYELSPPTTEAAILENPLGLLITNLNITQEGR